MEKLIVKGYEIQVKVTKSAYDRKAVLFANNIVDELKKLGITRDDIEIDTKTIGNKNLPAVLEFWFDGYYHRFSYSLAKRFIDNLYVIKELVRLEVEDVLTGKKDIRDFLHDFTDTEDRKSIGKDLKDAKKTLGVDENESDFEKINNAYRALAKKHHPDAGGDMEEFQKINKAHKLIKKEMGL